MAKPSVENHWELRLERLIPLKRHVAFRVMRSRIGDWWWHPFLCSVSHQFIDWRPGGRFAITDMVGKPILEGIILSLRPGWFFEMTDALHVGGRPAKPTMVGTWSFTSTPRDHPLYEKVQVNGDCASFSIVIRHFSEAEYLKSKALGFEQGWNDAADKLVTICSTRPRPV